MRNPARIRNFCNQLATLWENECPDWRFGQLVMNVFGVRGNPDLFYVEENDFLDRVNKYFDCKEEADIG